MKINRKKIRFVDGFKIRNHLDDDFAVLHAHATEAAYFEPKFYIPKGEWWFDYRFKDELDFFIHAEETLDKLLKTMSYEKARAQMTKMMRPSSKIPFFEKKRTKKEGYTLVMVDGKTVRHYFDPEFVCGGHEFVYSYIPKKEIWLDVKMDKKEVSYVLLHEETERDLMAQGKSYDVAHEFATVADKELRRKNGGSYPGDTRYIWKEKTNAQIAQEVTVS